jgi:hypothetical protein
VNELVQWILILTMAVILAFECNATRLLAGNVKDLYGHVRRLWERFAPGKEAEHVERE